MKPDQDLLLALLTSKQKGAPEVPLPGFWCEISAYSQL